jgi:hypothetical protein
MACFSKEYNERDETYMNEELTIAIDKLRKRPSDWDHATLSMTGQIKTGTM